MSRGLSGLHSTSKSRTLPASTIKEKDAIAGELIKNVHSLFLSSNALFMEDN